MQNTGTEIATHTIYILVRNVQFITCVPGTSTWYLHSEKPLVPTYVEGTVRQNPKYFRIIFVVLRDTDTVIQ